MLAPFASLQGKTVLVTGATSLVGEQAAVTSAARGAKVVALCRDADRIEGFSQELRRASPLRHHIETFDMAATDKIAGMVEKIIAAHGPIEGFVHATGLVTSHIFPDVKYQTIDRLFKINALAAFEFIRHLALRSQCSAGLSCVFVAPVTEFDALAGNAAFCASRGAVTAAVRSMAHDLAALKIRINYLIPCPMQNEEYFADAPERDRLGLTEDDLSERLNTLAANAATLLSDSYAHVSGEIVLFDRNGDLNIMAYIPKKISKLRSDS